MQQDAHSLNLLCQSLLPLAPSSIPLPSLALQHQRPPQPSCSSHLVPLVDNYHHSTPLLSSQLSQAEVLRRLGKMGQAAGGRQVRSGHSAGKPDPNLQLTLCAYRLQCPNLPWTSAITPPPLGFPSCPRTHLLGDALSCIHHSHHHLSTPNGPESPVHAQLLSPIR